MRKVMSIRIEKDYIDYIFNTPSDTSEILFKEFLKKGEWKFNNRKNKEEKVNWWYEGKNDFEKNIALIFGRFIPESTVKDEAGENKDKYLQLVISEFQRFKDKSKFPEVLKNRIYLLINNLKNSGYEVSEFQATCSWRLVIGLGASHPQETSMTLHHIYGIPYIPGSAVKGVTKHWAILKFADNYNGGKESSFEDKINKISNDLESGKDLGIEVNSIKFSELIQIFGTQTQQGRVIFMDAYPAGGINLKMDIMNPHYPDYYSGKQSPGDWQNPNPIKFLTVEKTEFQFCLLSKEEHLLKKAESLLKEALKEHGIGAKTSLGYGIFENS